MTTAGPLRRPTRATTAGRAYLDLRNLARKQHRDTGELLQLYALEGFLARLTTSEFAERLILKGGVLLAAFDIRRPTRDVDVAAIALDGDAAHILRVVCTIAAIPADDGLRFDHAAASADAIRDGDEYGGVRVTLPCSLDRAVMRFHVDVNIGDPIWPNPTPLALPRLLDEPLTLLGYPLAMVFAEKIVTAVQRGQANTRWRDFADIYLLSGRHDHHGRELVEAIKQVASHRHADLRPLAIELDGYEAIAQSRWQAWRRRQALEELLPSDFTVVLTSVIAFADPAINGSAQNLTWSHEIRAWQ